MFKIETERINEKISYITGITNYSFIYFLNIYHSFIFLYLNLKQNINYNIFLISLDIKISMKNPKLKN